MYTNISISKRFLQTSSSRLSLSDPFKPKKRETIFDDDFKINEKNKNAFKPENRKQKTESNDNLLAKMVKMTVNPAPLNLKIREKFNLNDDFKLIYTIGNEQIYLISNGFINLLFPLIVALAGFIFVTELTGRSKFSESFEDFYIFSFGMLAWISCIYFIGKKIQKSTILRIYHNPKINQYVSIRTKNLFDHVKEEFKKEDVIYRLHAGNKVGPISKKLGNICIKNEPRQVEFDFFITNEAVEKLFGSECFKVLKSKYKF